MKRLFSLCLCIALCAFFLPAAAQTQAQVLFADDFSAYTEGTVIPTTTGWTTHVKNDTYDSAGKAYKEGSDMVCRFSISTENQNSGPELRKTIDISGMEDLTFSCRAKQAGGTSCQIILFTDGKQNKVLATVKNTSWTNVNIVFDLINMTYTATVDGTATATNEALGVINNSSTFMLCLKQNINSTKFGYWDDVLITSMTVPETTTVDESDWFAWTIPDESKAKGTAIDASFMLDKPAGKHGFVKADGDRFVFEDGTPAQFWGTNVVFNANYMPHDQAEILADRIARSGYNIVRLHMMDTTRNPSIFQSGTTRAFREDILDRLFYFTAKLKERGVYIYMDLLVQRKAYAADGIQAVSDVDNKGWQSESHYDDYLLFLQQEYASMLLTRVNPYTNLTYAQDPQMAMVGITNESSVADLMHASAHYPSTTYYQGVLNGKFNTWLKTKYASTAALRNAWAEDGKTGLLSTENLENGTVDVQKDICDKNRYSAQRRRDTNAFLIALEEAFYTQMRAYLIDEVGIRCPCTGNALGGYGAIQANLYANAKFTDYVARNNYYGTNASVLFNASHIESISSARVYGKPYIVTEWCCFEPCPFIAESSLLMSTYARFQGWNMIKFQMWHDPALPASQAAINTTFTEYPHPIRTALAPATGQNFLRGDVVENTTEYYYPKTYDDATNPNWTSMSAIQNTGIFAKTGLMYSDVVQNNAASDPTVLAAIEAKQAGSDAANISGQIYWNTQTADFRLQTDYTQAIAGYRSTAAELTYVKFDMDNTYYTAILNSMTKNAIQTSDRLLLSVASHCHNTGREVTGDYSSITNTGTGPVLVEPVTGSVTIKLARAFDVYALTSSGERKQKLPVTRDANGYSTFELTAAQQTLNYEICTADADFSALYTPHESAYAIQNTSIASNKVTFSVVNTGETNGQITLVAAAYKNGVLADLRLQGVTLNSGAADTFSATFANKDFDNVVLFAVNGFLDMRIASPTVTVLP